MALVLTNAPENLRFNHEDNILSAVKEGITGEYILVIPTNRNVRSLKRELIKNAEISTSELNIFTLELLIRKIYLELKSGKYEIEPDMQSILVEEAAVKLLKEHELNFFKGRPDGKLPKGTFDKVFRIICEFKEEGLYVSDLENDLKSIDEKEIEKTTDIYKIYKQYNTFLGDRFIDKGDIYKTVNDGFVYPFSADIFKKVFPEVTNIYIYGFSEFSQPEIKFLSVLSEIKNLNISFLFDYNPSNIPLFGIMKQNVDKFYGLNFKESVSKSHDETESFKSIIQKYLFVRNRENTTVDFSEQVTIFTAKERLEEVEYISKIIKGIVLENPGQDLSKICVATYSTDKYTDLFREYFEKYGLPVNITDRFVLSSSPLVSALISFLQIPVNNYRKKELFRALLSPYMVFRKPNGKIIDANSLFEAANNLKISFGKESWTEKIERKLKFLQNKNIADEDERNVKREIYRLEEARGDFEFVKFMLAPFEGKLSSREFEIEFTRLIHNLEIPSQILKIKNNSNSRFLMEKDLRALSSFLSILKNMNNLYELKSETGNLHTLKEYLDDLKTAVSNTRYNVKQKNGYGILITAAEETRGLNFDYMFLAGMVDGEFPAVFKPEIFKPEIRRKSEEKHYLESRYLFYQMITNYNKKLFISYPKFENDSELLPSSFLSSLKDIVLTNENISEYIDNKIYSTDELQALLGSFIKNDCSASIISENYSSIIGELKSKSLVEQSRTKIHDKPNYEGIITNYISEKAKTALDAYLVKEFSISELEEYGKCPMRYLFSRALRIEVTEEIDDDITAMEFGSVIHDALYEFFTEWKKNNPDKSFYKQSEEDLVYNQKELINIAKRKVDELNITNPFFQIDFLKVIGDGVSKSGILKKFLNFELKNKNDRFADMIFEPEFFEVSFGKYTGAKDCYDANLSTDTSITLNNVAMRGKVDRIDLYSNGKDNIFVIFDYKTGKYIPGLKQILEGTSLQLPVYIACIDKLLSGKSDSHVFPAGGIYYLLGDSIALNPGIGDKIYYSSPRSAKLIENEKFQEIINKSASFVSEYVHGISNGIFGFPKPERDLNEICKYCNYITICRIKCLKFIENIN